MDYIGKDAAGIFLHASDELEKAMPNEFYLNWQFAFIPLNDNTIFHAMSMLYTLLRSTTKST